MNRFYINNFPIVDLYKKKSLKSEVVTQIIYGQTFKKIYNFSKWIKIKIKDDNYTGYVKKKNFHLI